jgi:Ala-tRNA(Pro) deacylase
VITSPSFLPARLAGIPSQPRHKREARSDNYRQFDKANKEDAMPIRRLREFLDSHHIKYFVISHSPAYTAQDIAAVAHVSGNELVKTVMVTVDGKMAMVLLHASRHLDFDLLRQLCGSRDVALAEEQEFSGLFPECEIGAMPPFGNLYGMEVYADEELDESIDIVFSAGSHRELLRLSWFDYKRLVAPVMGRLTSHS